MKIKIYYLVAIFTLLLTACQPTVVDTITPQTPVATPTLATAPASSLPTLTENSTLTATQKPTVVFTASAPATCTVVPVVPPLPAEFEKLVPSAVKEDWSYGPENARIIIYEYSDFQCPYCAKITPVLKKLQENYPNDVRVIYRHLPLSSIHDKATLAAQAAEAAGLQNKFWKMHDLLFEKQSEWAALSIDDFKNWLNDNISSIKLDQARFNADLTSGVVVQKVTLAEASAKTMELSSTPSLFFNKFPYQNRTDQETLTGVVEYFFLADKGFTTCPEMTIDPKKQYAATIKTEKGEIVLKLYADKAPWAVNSFVYLSKNKWFDNSTFFRVIPEFLVQAGDPTGSGLGNPGYRFSNEVMPELRFTKPGLLGMANSGTDTNGSQFFITYTAVPDLDGKYTIFGEVISGMEVLSSLRPRNPEKDALLLPADPLISITIAEK
jgi:cyclophilin family peptidyl-prolyl cis-trans isomerase/protein-disulfide isomerase